ncbi:MAG: DNA adenine methylase, partial [Phycisphaerales bacterium]|nr:DNA adenine methylase [Phycisphaerales bacterium]
MVKYLGSKRLLVPAILRAVGDVSAPGGTVLDLFSGTSRVGHALKRAGYRVIASDHNGYAATLARCYVQADREDVLDDAERLVAELNRTASRVVVGVGAGGEEVVEGGGWFARAYAGEARFFRAGNAGRIEAVREAIAAKGLEAELEAVLLTSLLEAADRVDSTTGVQMAYLKSWSWRSGRRLELRVPGVLPRAAGGKGEAHLLDAAEAAQRFEADVAYIDPPYNQHSYLGNYHVWETLVRWDAPGMYGVARKREDVQERKSAFNSR